MKRLRAGQTVQVWQGAPLNYYYPGTVIRVARRKPHATMVKVHFPIDKKVWVPRSSIKGFRRA